MFFFLIFETNEYKYFKGIYHNFFLKKISNIIRLFNIDFFWIKFKFFESSNPN